IAGHFAVFNEPAGDYRVVFIPQSNFLIVPGTPDHYDLTLSASGAVGAGFLVEQYGSVSGQIYLDANSDSRLDFGDTAPFAGGTIFIDQSNNGVLDTGEPSSNGGTFGFGSLVPGISYHLGIVPAAGYQAEIPATGLPVITPEPGDNVGGVNFPVIPVSNSST